MQQPCKAEKNEACTLRMHKHTTGYKEKKKKSPSQVKILDISDLGRQSGMLKGSWQVHSLASGTPFFTKIFCYMQNLL